MSQSLNWLLLGAGAVLILLEIVLGAITGFDFLLIGSTLAAGGLLGLVTGSPALGLSTAGILALAYLLVGRRQLRRRLKAHGADSNTDALLGRPALVVEEIRADRAGRVRVDADEWRAVLDDPTLPSLPAGRAVLIRRIEGVTVFVSARDAEVPEGVAR